MAPVNLHETFADYMLGEMKYELMADEQIASVCGLEMLKYVQSQNELSLYWNPATGHTVAKWVDDLITRGQGPKHEKFWNNLQRRFESKSWGYVKPGCPRAFCNKEDRFEIKDGVEWYSMSQANDIEQCLLM